MGTGYAGHFDGAGLELRRKIVVPVGKVCQHIVEQSLGNRQVHRHHQIDDMVCPRHVGRVEFMRFCCWLEWQQDQTRRIGTQENLLSVEDGYA